MDKITLEKITEEDISLIEQWLKNDYYLSKKHTLVDNLINKIKNIDGEYDYIKYFMVNINAQKAGFCQYYDCFRAQRCCDNIDKENIRYSIDYFIDGNYSHLDNEITIVKILIEKIKNEGGKEIILETLGVNSLKAYLLNSFHLDDSRKIHKTL
jgi:hypothetical protein